ncbi:MAG: YncE family protein, partial [Acidimicrobiales bacterium]
MTTPSKVIPVGSMLSNNGVALTTLAVNPTTAGDILVLATASYGNSDLVTAVSGGGVTTWTELIYALPSGGDGQTSLWWGVITSPGPSTITITTSATYFNFLVCQQFTMGGAGIWTADVVSALAVGTHPYSIAIDPAGAYAYVANYGGTVTKINLSTFLTVGSALTVGTGPYSIAIAPSGATSITAAVSASASVAATNTEAVALTAAVAPSASVAATNTQVVALTCAVASSASVAAT